MKPTERREIEFHQLCAIARTVLEANPTITDAEWKDRTREKAAKQGYAEAPPDMLPRAMSQVEHALVRTLGPRPVDLPPAQPVTVKPQQDDPPWHRGKTPAGWAIVQRLMASLKSAVLEPPSTDVLPEAEREFALSEDEVLNLFWTESSAPGANRVALLQAFAEVAIVRPSGWDPAVVREEAGAYRVLAAQCFACFSAQRALAWHHVIQIQHGGSNTPRNRVGICPACHADIHPWLDAEARKVPGWSKLSDVIVPALSEWKRQTGTS